MRSCAASRIPFSCRSAGTSARRSPTQRACSFSSARSRACGRVARPRLRSTARCRSDAPRARPRASVRPARMKRAATAARAA
eukprot:7022863-Alexandrium_andersonii.AAC.1